MKKTNPIKTLNTIKNNQTVTVKSISGKDSLKRRIMEMGITAGTKIKIVKSAPFADPIEVSVRNYRLTLRKLEAKNIEIT